jgi:hypothetical protein
MPIMITPVILYLTAPDVPFCYNEKSLVPFLKLTQNLILESLEGLFGSSGLTVNFILSNLKVKAIMLITLIPGTQYLTMFHPATTNGPWSQF